jgi:hypothetical protein
MTDKLTDEQAADEFIWLTNTAGTELQSLTGGAAHAPVFDERAVDYLRQISQIAGSLADHHGGEVKAEEKAEKKAEHKPAAKSEHKSA